MTSDITAVPGFLFFDHVAISIKPGELEAHVDAYKALGFTELHREDVLGGDQVREVASRKVVFGYALNRLADGELLATAATTMFVLDAGMRSARLPSDVASWLLTSPDPVRIS